jgi:DNA ligase-1
MTVAFKPLLAADYEPNKQRFPGWLSPKIDGIRAVHRNAPLTTRSNKPLPNKAVREKFAPLTWLDMELTDGLIDPLTFDRSTSTMRTVNGSADNAYAWVFDHTQHLILPYHERHQMLLESVDKLSAADREYVMVVEQQPVSSHEQMLVLETDYIDHDFEGAMYRDPNAAYKCGRSTVNEGILLKVKRYKDAECRIKGFVEQMQNTNATFINELGRTKRSTHAAGMVGKGTLGALEVVGINGRFAGVEFCIGGGKGLDAKKRQYIWDHKEEFMDQIGVYEYFDHGSKNAPRHPLWKGGRMEEDMS